MGYQWLKANDVEQIDDVSGSNIVQRYTEPRHTTFFNPHKNHENPNVLDKAVRVNFYRYGEKAIKQANTMTESIVSKIDTKIAKAEDRRLARIEQRNKRALDRRLLKAIGQA